MHSNVSTFPSFNVTHISLITSPFICQVPLKTANPTQHRKSRRYRHRRWSSLSQRHPSLQLVSSIETSSITIQAKAHNLCVRQQGSSNLHFTTVRTTTSYNTAVLRT